MNNEHTSLLQQIFDNTNNWLQFAEAKNAALIALNVALLAAFMSSDDLQAYTFLFTVIIIGLLISLAFTVWSVKPINKKLEKVSPSNVDANLLHYAFIASLGPEEYIQNLYATYWGEPNKSINTIPQIEKDYCTEIISNSRITIRKQKYFKLGFYTLLLTVFVIATLFIYA